MDKLQTYAEARRSGAYQGAQLGSQLDAQAQKAFNAAKAAVDNEIGRFHRDPLPIYSKDDSGRFPRLWTAVNIVLSAILIAFLIYLMKFADRKDFETVQKAIERIPMTQNEIKAAFLNWAYSPETGIGLKCGTMTRHSKSIFLLYNCVFTEGNRLERGRVILGQEVKPNLPIGGEYANTQP